MVTFSLNVQMPHNKQQNFMIVIVNLMNIVYLIIVLCKMNVKQIKKLVNVKNVLININIVKEKVLLVHIHMYVKKLNKLLI